MLGHFQLLGIVSVNWESFPKVVGWSLFLLQEP